MEFDLGQIAVPFRMQPGLSKMSRDARHTRLLESGSKLYREKLSVLRGHHDQALVQAVGFDARASQLALAQCLAIEWPEACSLADGSLHLHEAGLKLHFQTNEMHPVAKDESNEARACVLAMPAHLRIWAALALFIQDDVAVLDGGSTRVKAMAVCAPSHWAPEEKVDLPLASVHAPVADNVLLLQASQSLSRLVTADGSDRWQRFVWTLQPSAQYDGHPKRAAPRMWPRDLATLGEHLWLRVEHQTFIAVPSAQQAVFTIRVMLEPLGTLIVGSPRSENALRLHNAIASMSESVVAYRGLSDIRPVVLKWLERFKAT